jgi:hypothetical protein
MSGSDRALESMMQSSDFLKGISEIPSGVLVLPTSNTPQKEHSDKPDTLHVFVNDYGEGYVANSILDVALIYKDHTGMDYDPDEGGVWKQIPDDQMLTICSEEAPMSGHPEDVTMEIDDGYFCYTSTAEKWAAANGAGLLFSPEF